jgi:hypothetical protein
VAKAKKKSITSPDKLDKLRHALHALDPETLRMMKHSQDHIESLKSIDKAVTTALRSARNQPPNPPAIQPTKKTSTARWITDEARRLKGAGEIKEGMRITDFAKLLEARMREAAKTDVTLRAVTWQYIKNHLAAWGLWPINSIK